MNTAEKLKLITADIREKLPRLMKLEEGCIIKDTFDKEKFKIVKDFGYALGLLSLESDVVTKVAKSDLSIEKIIGKEPMLTDVLEWLDNDYYSHFEIIDGKGAIVDYSCEETIIYYIDLSKPYLKDWSEEVIDYLYEFVKK